MRRLFKQVVVLIIVAIFLMPTMVQAAQVHRVAPGESLFGIARSYDLTVNELLNQNSYIKNPNAIFARQVLIVPSTDKTVYHVMPGDSLYRISSKLGVSVKDLVEANNIKNPDQLSVGQILKIPSNGQKVISSNYTVKPGDSLFRISQHLGVSIASLAKENNISNLDMIYVGQVIKVPSYDPGPVPKEPEPDFVESVSNLVRQFPNDFYLKGRSNSNKIALTFDDGPDEVYTAQVLRVLKDYGIKATFFVLGSKAEEQPQLIKQIMAEGHTIGNHTWSHPDLRKVDQNRLVTEMKRTEDILKDITGVRTALMRPPYGGINTTAIQQLKSLDYKAINWSVDSVDWRDQDVDKILINSLSKMKGIEDIVLFHDSGGDREATVKALPELIETLRFQGYTFVTVDELLGVPAYR